MKARLLALIPLPQHTLDALAAAYDLSCQPDCNGQPELAPGDAARTVGLITNGSTGCSAALLERLPSLRVICSFGAGYEKIDLGAAGARSLPVTHAPGANAATVADHALGFALALARGYCGLTEAVKAGRWKASRGERATLNGSTVGIVGMGRVGQLIARRAAGFDARIAYFDVGPRPAVEGTFYDSVPALAAASDFLIAACPGGPSTHHLLNAAVFAQLGPGGYVINVSRGSVVDTVDLIAALRAGTIAGAGLDVLEEEPEVPQALRELANVLLTPHVAGRSPASFVAQREVLLQSLDDALAGRACSYLVPELRRGQGVAP